MFNLCKLAIPAVLGLALAGCGGAKVKLHDPTIPEPLIAQLPLSVGARYPEIFANFVHEEKIIGKEKWTIDLGRSNELLFTHLFSSMFTEFQVVEDGMDPDHMNLDALIEPTIDAFEFSVPNQSKSDEFAVWIRYRIKIYDDAGDEIANWPISAYGKTQAALFRGDDALRRAAVLAMRDAAALIIMQMDKATGISKLSAASGDGAPAVPAPDISSENDLRTTAAEEIDDKSP